MCGIVGYSGPSSATGILLEGLQRLEYRGYDSAGVALYSDESFQIKRSVGKVSLLKEILEKEEPTEKQGIAHTRWATHGVPSETNAHPHKAGRIVLVHNGIIENYAEIKEELQKKGVHFESQTDTEVFTKLLDSYLGEAQTKKEILEALQKTLKKAQGHYSVLFMVHGFKNVLFSALQGAPLVYAQNKEAIFIGSDIQAFLGASDEFYMPPPGTLSVACPGKEIEFFNAKDLESISVKTEKISWSPEQIQKEGYEHFMLKEIFEQARVVADTLSGRLPEDEEQSFIWDHPKAHETLWKNVDRLYLVACGTAYYSALVAKYYFEQWAKIPVDVDLASEFRYRKPVLQAGTAMGVISQSGETADTLAALRLANEQNVTTFCICNVPASTIVRESQFQYMTKAGPEIGVASTKAFTTQLTVLCALALDASRLRNQNVKESQNLIQSLARLPHDIETVLNHSKEIQEVGSSLEVQKTILFIGRGSLYPISLEGALKLKEITYRHAEGYAAGELKHGPIALIEESLTTIVLATEDPELLPKTLSNLEEIKSRKGKIIGVGHSNCESFKKLCDHYIEMPSSTAATAPILYVLPLQLLSYGLAKKLNREIDQPRNLAKSVTVE